MLYYFYETGRYYLKTFGILGLKHRGGRGLMCRDNFDRNDLSSHSLFRSLRGHKAKAPSVGQNDPPSKIYFSPTG